MLTDEIRIPAWQQFAKTPEYAALKHSNKNSALLDGEVRAAMKDGGEYTCKALQLAVLKLRDALEWKPVVDAQAHSKKEEPVSAEPCGTPSEEYSEATDVNFPKQGPHEPGHIFQGRVNFYRESRAQRAWRARENKRLLEAPPAQSTINRTRLDIKLRRIEQDLWNQKKSNQS